MKSYQVKFKLEVPGKEFGDTFVLNTGHSLEYANCVVDEILEFRRSGAKSAILHSIEREFSGTFKQSSGSVVEIRLVRDDRIRIEGGVFDVVSRRKAKETIDALLVR